MRRRNAMRRANDVSTMTRNLAPRLVTRHQKNRIENSIPVTGDRYPGRQCLRTTTVTREKIDHIAVLAEAFARRTPPGDFSNSIVALRTAWILLLLVSFFRSFPLYVSFYSHRDATENRMEKPSLVPRRWQRGAVRPRRMRLSSLHDPVNISPLDIALFIPRLYSSIPSSPPIIHRPPGFSRHPFVRV